jgi:hypothetical protein
VTRVLSRYVELPATDPDTPDAFRFAQLGKLAAILKEVGITDVSERVLKFQMEAAISFEEFWTMRSEVSGLLREKLKSLTEAQSFRVAQEVHDDARQFFSNNGMSLPAEAIIVSGRKLRSSNNADQTRKEFKP